MHPLAYVNTLQGCIVFAPRTQTFLNSQLVMIFEVLFESETCASIDNWKGMSLISNLLEKNKKILKFSLSSMRILSQGAFDHGHDLLVFVVMDISSASGTGHGTGPAALAQS